MTDLYLYAQWRPTQYKVQLYKWVTPSTGAVTKSTFTTQWHNVLTGATKLADRTVSGVKYEFAGWYTAPGGPAGGGVKYDNTTYYKNTVSTDSNATIQLYLYAYWIVKATGDPGTPINPTSSGSATSLAALSTGSGATALAALSDDSGGGGTALAALSEQDVATVAVEPLTLRAGSGRNGCHACIA